MSTERAFASEEERWGALHGAGAGAVAPEGVEPGEGENDGLSRAVGRPPCRPLAALGADEVAASSSSNPLGV